VENCLHNINIILRLSNLTIMPLSMYTRSAPLCCSSTINQ